MNQMNKRLDIAKEAIERHFGEFSRESLLKDEILLNVALNVVFSHYTFLKVLNVSSLYGFIKLECNEEDILIVPFLDNRMMKSQVSKGKYLDIPYEDLVNVFNYSSKTNGKTGKVLQVRLFSNLGCIHKDIDEDFCRTPFHFKNKLFYFNFVWEDVIYDG